MFEGDANHRTLMPLEACLCWRGFVSAEYESGLEQLYLCVGSKAESPLRHTEVGSPRSVIAITLRTTVILAGIPSRIGFAAALGCRQRGDAGVQEFAEHRGRVCLVIGSSIRMDN